MSAACVAVKLYRVKRIFGSQRDVLPYLLKGGVILRVGHDTHVQYARA